MKIGSVILILVLLSLTCIKTDQRRKDYITNKNFKYWLVIENEGIKKSKTIYYFDIKGKWKVYTWVPPKKIENYKADDIVLSENWFLLNDTVINIGGRNYKIEHLSRKEFIYSNNGIEIKKLIEAPDSLFKDK